MKENIWIETDPDSRQHMRRISQNVFEGVEVRLVKIAGEEEWTVVKSRIDLTDYSESELEAIARSGYNSVGDVVDQYGDDAGQILAELIFEFRPDVAHDVLALCEDEEEVNAKLQSIMGSGRILQ